jgi:choline/carnitine/betaine transport
MDQNQQTTARGGLNHFVFWPPFLLLLASVLLSGLNGKLFNEVIGQARTWVVVNFGWLFTICAFSAVMLCIYICFSSFGNVRLGGRNAKPLMSRLNWFAITICTTIAVGILLWATAEPISHYLNPPLSSGIEGRTPAAATFAMSTMYLHWTFTPYAIYCVASLAFAFSLYNMKKPFSLGSPLTAIFGDAVSGRAGNLIDAVCLFSLVAGMAATLGGGILIIASGLHRLWNVIPANSIVLWAIIGIVIIATFIISSASGLMNGIRILSTINTYALLGLALFVFICGPTLFILGFGLESFGNYLTSFFEMNLFTGQAADDDWPQRWTIFYWAVWLAWTPVTACFLGQIAYGRTVREFMVVNFIFPSLFCGAWMAIFSGTALYLEMNQLSPLAKTLQDSAGGEQAVTFALFEQLPLPLLLIIFYVMNTFVCYVTSADSNTTAMANISSKGITLEANEASVWIKVVWGVTVGVVAWVMITFLGGTDGIKMISSLGGFPAAILVLLTTISLVKIVFQHETLNRVDASENEVN